MPEDPKPDDDTPKPEPKPKPKPEHKPGKGTRRKPIITDYASI